MSTNRRLEVEVVGNVSGFEAAMNRVNAGVSRVGTGLRGFNRDANQSSKLIRAIGTTARYAFAGQLLFGVTAAIGKLGQFKTELGQIDALASQIDKNGNLQGLGNQLDQVGTDAILMSNKFGVAVGDVEKYMQRFFSSFTPSGSNRQKVQQMREYTDAMLNLVTSLGSEAGDPQALAGGVTGLINSQPGGRKNPGKAARNVADMFAVVLRNTPSLTGQDIALAAGRIASAKQLSGMTTEQLLAAYGVAAKAGGSPSVISRGITQLFGQSLMHPTKPESKQVYASAGLPSDPNALAAMGGETVLEKLITFVQAGKVPGQKGNMNLDAVYNAFGRQESVRQFVNILAQGGIPALKDFNKQLKEGTKTNISRQMAQKRLQHSMLTRMGVASSNLGMSVVGGADWPLENLVGRPLIATSNFAAKHTTTTEAVVGGALTLGAANALRKMGAFGGLAKLGKGTSRLGKLGRFLGAASAAEQAVIGGAISKEELPNAILGGKTDGSRGNPYWVIISPLSWSLGGPSGMGGGSVVDKGAVDATEKVAKSIATKLGLGAAGGTAVKYGRNIFGGARGLFGKGIRGARGIKPSTLGKGAMRDGGIMAAASFFLFPDEISHNIHSGHDFGGFSLDHRGINWKTHPLLGAITKARHSRNDPWMLSHPRINSAVQGVANQGLSPDRAEKIIQRAFHNATRAAAIQVEGTAQVMVHTILEDKHGNVIATGKKGVPVKLWTAKQYPSNKGKPGSRKSAGK